MILKKIATYSGSSTNSVRLGIYILDLQHCIEVSAVKIREMKMYRRFFVLTVMHLVCASARNWEEGSWESAWLVLQLHDELIYEVLPE